MSFKKLCLNCGTINEPLTKICCKCTIRGMFQQIEAKTACDASEHTAITNVRCWNCGEEFGQMPTHCPVCTVLQSK